MSRLQRASLRTPALGFACMAMALLVGSVNALAQANQSPQEPPAVAPPTEPAFPKLNLPDAKSSGQRAVDLLGARLPEVAAWYGYSAEDFRTMLLKDKQLKIDSRGRLLVEEGTYSPAPAAPAASGAGAKKKGSQPS